VRVLREIEHRERQEVPADRLSDAVERESGVDARFREPAAPDVSAAIGPLAGLGLEDGEVGELLDERWLDVGSLAEFGFGQLAHSKNHDASYRIWRAKRRASSSSRTLNGGSLPTGRLSISRFSIVWTLSQLAALARGRPSPGPRRSCDAFE
jgi:hypothetical protein